MNSYEITNKNVNFPKEDISNSQMDKYDTINYGEVVREKRNYTLYASGQGYASPNYEDRNPHKKMSHNVILSPRNIGYKETKNIKNNNNISLDTVIIQERSRSPRPQYHSLYNIANKKGKIKLHKSYGAKKRVNKIYFNQEMNTNKSYEHCIPKCNQKIYEEYIYPQRGYIERYENDNLIQEIIENDEENEDNEYNNCDNQNEMMDEQEKMTKDGEYFIKITTTRKEFEEPKNEDNEIHQTNKKIKIIKMPYNKDKIRMYKNKYRERRDRFQHIPTYYYNEEDDNEIRQRYNNNYINREEYDNNEEYYECKDHKYMNPLEFERNRIFINKYDDYDDITRIRNIECPVHGNVSIVIHKNPFGYK
jgi:hypothetical protein